MKPLLLYKRYILYFQYQIMNYEKIMCFDADPFACKQFCTSQ